MQHLEYSIEQQHWLEYANEAQRRMVKLPKVGTDEYIRQLSIAVIIGAALLFVIVSADRQCAEATGGCGLDPISMLVGAFLMIATIWLLWLSAGTKAISRAVESDGVVLGKRQLDMSDEGITVTGPHDEATYKWAAIKGIDRSRSILTLWMEPMLGIFVPRNVFANKAAEEEFVRYALARMPLREVPGEVGGFSMELPDYWRGSRKSS